MQVIFDDHCRKIPRQVVLRLDPTDCSRDSNGALIEPAISRLEDALKMSIHKTLFHRMGDSLYVKVEEYRKATKE